MPIDIELHAAICAGDFKKADEIVKTNPKLAKGRDEKGETLLHRMAVYDVVTNALQESKSRNYENFDNLVSELIKNDPGILFVKNKKGRTALSLAINPAPLGLFSRNTNIPVWS